MYEQNSNGLDEYFKTSDYTNLKITPEQKLHIGKEIQLVKGSDFHKNIYDIPDANLVKDILVRYYQIAMFDEVGKYTIRSLLFKGNTSNCNFFEYKIIEIKIYKLSKRKLDKFVNFLDKEKKKIIKNLNLCINFIMCTILNSQNYHQDMILINA